MTGGPPRVRAVPEKVRTATCEALSPTCLASIRLDSTDASRTGTADAVPYCTVPYRAVPDGARRSHRRHSRRFQTRSPPSGSFRNTVPVKASTVQYGTRLSSEESGLGPRHHVPTCWSLTTQPNPAFPIKTTTSSSRPAQHITWHDAIRDRTLQSLTRHRTLSMLPCLLTILLAVQQTYSTLWRTRPHFSRDSTVTFPPVATPHSLLQSARHGHDRIHTAAVLYKAALSAFVEKERMCAPRSHLRTSCNSGPGHGRSPLLAPTPPSIRDSLAPRYCISSISFHRMCFLRHVLHSCGHSMPCQT